VDDDVQSSESDGDEMAPVREPGICQCFFCTQWSFVITLTGFIIELQNF